MTYNLNNKESERRRKSGTGKTHTTPLPAQNPIFVSINIENRDAVSFVLFVGINRRIRYVSILLTTLSSGCWVYIVCNGHSVRYICNWILCTFSSAKRRKPSGHLAHQTRSADGSQLLKWICRGQIRKVGNQLVILWQKPYDASRSFLPLVRRLNQMTNRHVV